MSIEFKPDERGRVYVIERVVREGFDIGSLILQGGEWWFVPTGTELRINQEDMETIASRINEEKTRWADHDVERWKTYCTDCGSKLTLVRPGKHQCDNEECIRNA
jgi:hypothetical protein